ncbi:MAG TPA: hypothetical protein VGJ15_03840 [Pirellulales bacterium]
MNRTAVCLFAVVVLGFVGVCRAEEEPKVLAKGDWSKPAGDNLGGQIRGRLLLVEEPHSDKYREVAVFVELQDARGNVGSTMHIFCDFSKNDFRPEYKGGLQCKVRDKDGNVKKIEPFPFSGAVPRSEWIVLPSKASIRLRSSPFGVARENGLAIAPDLGALWFIDDDDPNEYFLSGTFTGNPPADKVPTGAARVWRGTLELPPVKITGKLK